MSKNPIHSMSFDDPIGENPLIQWIIENRKIVVSASVFALLFVVLLYQIFAKNAKQDEKDFILATRDLVQLDQKDKQQKALVELESILKRHPELYASYDGVVAQELLNQGKEKEAEPFIARTLTRVENKVSPFYMRFAKTSLLIERKKKDEALAEAYELKSDMLANAQASPPLFGGTLYAFNLMRIFFLEKENKNKDAEELVRKELADMVQGEHPVALSVQGVNQILYHLDGKTSLIEKY